MKPGLVGLDINRHPLARQLLHMRLRNVTEQGMASLFTQVKRDSLMAREAQGNSGVQDYQLHLSLLISPWSESQGLVLFQTYLYINLRGSATRTVKLGPAFKSYHP